MLTVYHSPSCANSRRVVDIIERIPSFAAGKVNMKNVDTLHQTERVGLEYVPTIVDAHGRQYVGAKAYEFLKTYESELQLEYAPVSSGRLAFSSLAGSGENQYTENFGDFVKPA